MPETTKEFGIKIVDDNTASLSLEDKTVYFKYKCNGGEDERWRITLTTNDGPLTAYVGIITQPSYLIFESFEFYFKDDNDKITNFGVYNNSGYVSGQAQIEDNKLQQNNNWGGNLALAFIKGE